MADTSFAQFSQTATNAVAGKDILLAIYSADGTQVLAVCGQQGLTLNRSADSIEVTSKDTAGGWKAHAVKVWTGTMWRQSPVRRWTGANWT